jgi:AhpD family alkylhydroperoxidase
MTNKEKELIAIGASISAHCFSCLDFHLSEARKFGASEEEINDAVQVGIKVMNGSNEKMLEKIKTSIPNKSFFEKESCCN